MRFEEHEQVTVNGVRERLVANGVVEAGYVHRRGHIYGALGTLETQGILEHVRNGVSRKKPG